MGVLICIDDHVEYSIQRGSSYEGAQFAKISEWWWGFRKPPMAFHASNGVGKYGTHKSSYPLAMTNSLPWYRWPIEIEVYLLKMVDLSMSNC